MATYNYRAYGPQGEYFEGSIEAANSELARDMLWSQGRTPFRIHAATQGDAKWWQRELFSGSPFKGKDLVAFTREFATLAAAEMPLDDTLRILRDQATSPPVRMLVDTLLADVLNGSTLSDAMQRHAQIFASDYTSVIRAGEIGGRVGEVVAELADLLERRMEIRARIQSAFVYPSILIALSFGSLAIIIGGLVPSIAPMLAGSGKPLPPVVAFLLAIHSRWPDVLLGATAVIAGLLAARAIALRQRACQVGLDRLKLRLPVFGALILQQQTARFTRTLGTMLRAGVPLLQAATSARAVLTNRQMSTTMEAVVESVGRGVALNHALATEGAFSSVAVRMISVGEEAGKLDRMLLRVAVMLEQQSQRTIERLMTVLTPALTVAISLLVGLLILPVMNAVLSINDIAFR
jgi:general secretion pathway protein F